MDKKQICLSDVDLSDAFRGFISIGSQKSVQMIPCYDCLVLMQILMDKFNLTREKSSSIVESLSKRKDMFILLGLNVCTEDMLPKKYKHLAKKDYDNSFTFVV